MLALKVMLENSHLLVLVEFSCTLHFEYDLGEDLQSVTEHDLSSPLNSVKTQQWSQHPGGHLEGLWIIS